MVKKSWLAVSVILNVLLLFVALLLGVSLYGELQEKKNHPATKVEQKVITNKLFSSMYEDGDILFIGGELMEYCAWSNILHDRRICNLSMAEYTMELEQLRAESIFEEKTPAQIVLMLGMRDLQEGQAVNKVFENFENYVHFIKEKLPQTEIVIHSLLPLGADVEYGVESQLAEDVFAYNLLIKMFALKEGFTYLNMYDEFLSPEKKLLPRYNSGDGFRLNAEAYKHWAYRLAPLLPSK